MILAQLKPHRSQRFMRILFACSQFSLFVVIVVPRLFLSWAPGWFPVDFVLGLLTGFSLVGNLASLLYFGGRFPFKEEVSDDRKN